MKRVTGLGGVFFKCNDPAKQREWYERHLGISNSPHGFMFEWRDKETPDQTGYTVWSAFPATTKYFDPAKKEFMLNYRVENLRVLLEELKKEGVQIVGEMQESEYGNFGWIMDPEGNKIELFEPPKE